MDRIRRVVVRSLAITAGIACLLFVLMVLEATGGHDGWLCEWGIDTDGAGTTTSGCG